jgi:hypothetical protein
LLGQHTRTILLCFTTTTTATATTTTATAATAATATAASWHQSKFQTGPRRALA